jgi:hypothetical protein
MVSVSERQFHHITSRSYRLDHFFTSVYCKTARFMKRNGLAADSSIQTSKHNFCLLRFYQKWWRGPYFGKNRQILRLPNDRTTQQNSRQLQFTLYFIEFSWSKESIMRSINCFNFWVYPQRLIYIGRRFGTLYQVHLMDLIDAGDTPKNWNSKILNTAKVENQ